MVVVDQKLKKRSKKMNREQSDGENSMRETEVVPGGEDTGESEVELHLPHEAGLKPDRIPKDIPSDIPAAMGTAGADTDMHDPGQMRRFEAVGGSNSKQPRFDVPARETPGLHGLSPNAGTRPGKPGTDGLSFDPSAPDVCYRLKG